MSWCLLQSMQHACTFAPCTTTRSFNSCSACACSCTTTAYTFLHACACMSARLCTTSRQLLTQRVWQQLALHAALDAANKRSEKQVRKWHARRRCSGLWQPLVPAHAHGSAGPESSRGTPWGGGWCGHEGRLLRLQAPLFAALLLAVCLTPRWCGRRQGPCAPLRRHLMRCTLVEHPPKSCLPHTEVARERISSSYSSWSKAHTPAAAAAQQAQGQHSTQASQSACVFAVSMHAPACSAGVLGACGQHSKGWSVSLRSPWPLPTRRSWLT